MEKTVYSCTFSKDINSDGPFHNQNIVRMTSFTDCCDQKFFFTGISVYFYSMDCLFHSGFLWQTQVLPICKVLGWLRSDWSVGGGYVVTSTLPLDFRAVVVIIYKTSCLDVAQSRMNRTPNETRTHSLRFASSACEPLHHPRRPHQWSTIRQLLSLLMYLLCVCCMAIFA